MNSLLRIWTHIFLALEFRTLIFFIINVAVAVCGTFIVIPKQFLNCDFEDYEDRGCNQVISSAVRSERDDIHFERDLPKTYIKSNIEKDSILNSLFIKKRKKKRTINDCKRLMF